MDMLKPPQEEETPQKASDLTVFASNSTLHGISHVFLPGGVTPRRVFWACAFLASLSIFLYQVADRIIYYTQYHHVTTLDEMESSKMTFPAVTICNYNGVRKSAMTYDDLLEVAEMFKINKEDTKVLSAFNMTTKTRSNGSQMPFNVTEFYDRTGHTIDDMMLECRYQNKPCGPGDFTVSTVSESTLIGLLAARKNKILEMKSSEPESDDSHLNSRLIAYASDQAHSSVEKAGLISLVKVRFLPVDENFSLRGETLKAAVEEDRKRGLVPVFVCATLGTTGVCAFDNLAELGPVCAKEGLWLHIDAAYAGTAFLCPEFRTFLKGVDYADSFTFNPSKWMMVHFDCTAFWVKDKYKLQQTFSVNPIYLRHANTGAATDFMHWQIPLSRRFRSLKLWFVIRSFGVKNLQAHIRHGTELAKYFESLVKSDSLFEIPAKRHLGLVVFRLKGPNSLTEQVLADLTKSGKMFLVPATIHDKLIIRFTVTSQFTTKEDIHRDWILIQETAINVTNRFHSSQIINGSVPNEAITISNPHIKRMDDQEETAQRVTVQPKHGGFTPKEWIEDIYEDNLDPFDDCFPENVPVATKLRPTTFKYRYWSIQDKRKSARSLSCNSVPVHSPREAPVEKLVLQDELQKDGSILSKLPGKVMILEKNAFRKLIKFYSVPSFPEFSIQCGLKLPCCPLQALV
ncbi:histidine decarboxylase [Pelobates cultripes]|uniref:Histidine decarboxylase n=1 Tax=Pelobates cultripes TaxID=61616 RepID=A0AAD1RLL6_PELCU|nr:histidine decarboxylase [Pelobates cultripes]